MSRVYQKPPRAAARQTTRPSNQPPPPTTSATRGAHAPVHHQSMHTRPPRPENIDHNRPNETQRPNLQERTTRPSNQPPTTSATRGAHAPVRHQSMHTRPPRPENIDHNRPNETQRPNLQERTTHVGDGFHMITPSTTKREQIQRQAENEQRQYEEHLERKRLHNLHEVHRLGGDGLSEEEVRQRQADKFRREKYMRLEKAHQNQMQRKQEEEKEIEAKKQAARLQSIENENRDRNNQHRSIRATVNQSPQGATGWTDEDREADRQQTMNRFLDRLTQKCDAIEITSDDDEKPYQTNSKKLAILHETLPGFDDETLEHYLEIYNGNVDRIVNELLNET